MKDLLKLFKYQNPVDDFEAIRIGLAVAGHGAVLVLR